jgi:predicted nucleotidyltransferase
MARKRAVYVQPYRYPSPHIPMSAIKRFARRIAERFHPEKIILFGSYAYGKPHNESDVDLLVIMPASNEINKSIQIMSAFERPFALDLIVKTPERVERALKEENWFLREVIDKGKVLYEASNGAVDSKGRRRPNGCPRAGNAQADAKRSGLLPLSTGRRYPIFRADSRQVRRALRIAEQVRTTIRSRLGLQPIP